MPHRYVVCLFVFALTPAWAGAAVNLVANPGFATDTTQWQLSGAPAVLDWSPLDEAGMAGMGESGSLRLSAIAPNVVAGFYNDCFPVTPGAHLVYGGSFSAAADGETGVPRLRLALYEAPNCVGAFRDDVDDLRAYTPDSVATWGPIQGYTTATAKEVSGRLFVQFASKDDPPSEVRFDNFFVHSGATCAAGFGVTCLDDRFRVTVNWKIPDGTQGHGQMHALTSDSAVVTFFAPENVEVLVKVLNACAVNDRYWVFAAGLTNVEVTLTVTDTQTGTTWNTHNPLDQEFPPIQDTVTFAVCSDVMPS
jgi:hypothetical protein